MIRQETIIKRMILKTALPLFFVTTCCLCSKHSNAVVILDRQKPLPSLEGHDISYTISEISYFDPGSNLRVINTFQGSRERSIINLQPPTKIVGKAEDERLDYNKS